MFNDVEKDIRTGIRVGIDREFGLDSKDLRHLQNTHVERNPIGNWIFPREFRRMMARDTVWGAIRITGGT